MYSLELLLTYFHEGFSQQPLGKLGRFCKKKQGINHGGRGASFQNANIGSISDHCKKSLDSLWECKNIDAQSELVKHCVDNYKGIYGAEIH